MWNSLGMLAVNGGPWGLVTFFVVSVWRGWLIPRSWHRERMADFKAANAALEDTVKEQNQQIALLVGRNPRR